MRSHKNSGNLVKGREDMSGSYVNRLKRDANELNNYMTKLKKQGRNELAMTIAKKYQYLESRIAEMEEILAA